MELYWNKDQSLSSTSSARIKTEADMPALIARKKQKDKHDLEEQERLRKRKEELDLEMEMAASIAKVTHLILFLQNSH